MKKIITLLGVLAMLGMLMVLSPTASAGDDNTRKECRAELGIDMETFKQLEVLEGWNLETCCIDWETEDVVSWAVQYQCARPVCTDAFGEDFVEDILDTYGGLIDTEACCIAVDELANIPAEDQKHICVVVVPPTTVPPTTVPPPDPTPDPTPDPEPEPEIVFVERPVIQTVRPAFTG